MNEYRGASRRWTARATLLIVLALLLVVVTAGAAQAVSYSSEEAAFASLINDYRAANGLQPLLVSDALSEAGDRHSHDMGTYRFFDHYTVKSDWFASGATPFARMAACGYSYSTSTGENIAAGYTSAAAVFQAWRSSTGHNANMLSANYRVMGVSMVAVSGSPYGVYWTTDFGGYVDGTAHNLGSAPAPSTTTTLAPTTTTVRVTTTAAPTTTTTRASTTTTLAPPPATTTTTTTAPTVPSTTTTTTRPTTTSTTKAPTPSTSATSTTVAPGPVASFRDVDGDTLYAASIRAMAKEEVVTGFVDGTFRPEQPVTRQQFAKIIMLALHGDVPVPTTTTFRDVATRLDGVDPLYPLAYVEACVQAGITVGTAPGTFSPLGTVTRAQLITMVARAAQLPAAPAGVTAPFGDFSSQHYPWALRAYAAGLLDGFVDMGRQFAFWAPATRAEVCLLLAQLHD